VAADVLEVDHAQVGGAGERGGDRSHRSRHPPGKTIRRMKSWCRLARAKLRSSMTMPAALPGRRLQAASSRRKELVVASPIDGLDHLDETSLSNRPRRSRQSSEDGYAIRETCLRDVLFRRRRAEPARSWWLSPGPVALRRPNGERAPSPSRSRGGDHLAAGRASRKACRSWHLGIAQVDLGVRTLRRSTSSSRRASARRTR